MQAVRAFLQTVHHSLEFIKSVGLIFDYLFVDSYRYEQILKLFVENGNLIPLTIRIISSHEQLTKLAQCYSKSKAGVKSHLPVVFSKVLFKLLTNQCTAAKSQFLALTDGHSGITTLKSFLTTFRQESKTYEEYLYCLGMVPCLLTLSQNYNEDFIDAGYISLLSRQLISFQEEDGSSYIGMVTPLLLALKALVTASPEMREELKVNMELINVLYSTVSSSFGSRSHQAHLHLAGTILMCELGHDVFTSIIRDRLSEMQTSLKSAPENQKVHSKEQINRVMDWSNQFAKDHEMYVKSTEAVQTIKTNVFDDDLIEKSLVNLRTLWKTQPKSRQLIQVEFGHMDAILGCLRNADEGVVLNVCQSLEVLLTPSGPRYDKKHEILDSLIDLMVRHGGLALLNTQIRVEGNLDIKKAALKVMIKVLGSQSTSL